MCIRDRLYLSHQPVTERKTGHRGNGWHTLCTIDGGRGITVCSATKLLVCGEYVAPSSPRDSQCSAALPRHDLCANRSYSTIFIQPKLKGDQTMKKFLSIFVALAMVLSLFAGIGARSAKAATTLTVTPVSYTHLRAHETRHDLVCRLLL